MGSDPAAAPPTGVAGPHAPGYHPPGTLFVLSLAQQHTPEAWHEPLAIGANAATRLRDQLRKDAALSEYLLLATCNRLEVYGVCATADAAAQTTARVAEILGRHPEAVAGHCQVHTEADAAAHLFAVASGLESQLLGETEILGQVKEAYDLAGRDNTLGSRLHRLLQKTFQAAKLIRSETGIARGQISIGNVAVDLATRIFGDLTQASLLVVGSGEVGELTAKAFRSRGAARLLVSSRNLETANRLAEAVGASAVAFADWPKHLPEVDVVVTATAAPTAILARATVAAALRSRSGRPLFLIDLAVPRDIDPEVANLGDVYLYTLADLAQIARDNLAARQVELGRARELIAARADAAVRR